MNYIKTISSSTANVSHVVFLSSMAVNDTKQNESQSLSPSILGTAIADFSWQRNFLGESQAELDFKFLNTLPTQPFFYCSETDYKKVPYWRFGFVSVIKSMENGMLDGPPVGTSIKYKYDFRASNATYSGKVMTIAGQCNKALGSAVQQELKNSFTSALATTAYNEVAGGGHYFWITNLADAVSQIKTGLLLP